MNFFYWLYIIIGTPLVWLLCPCRVYGKKNIPADGPLIVCANHTALLDPVLILIHFGPRYKMHFMAKKELFKNPFAGAFLRSAGAFPVDRDSADVGAIKTSMKYLRKRGRLMIFPEGKRVTKEESVQAKLGAVRIALKSDAKILPVWLSPGRKLFRGTKMIIGEPYKQEAPEDRNYDPLINELMEKIYALGSEQ